jgi:hypothetical protein
VFLKATTFAPIRPFSNFLVPFMGIAWGFGGGLVGWQGFDGGLMGLSPNLGMAWEFGGGLVGVW